MSTSTLTVATHSITAKYLGNGNYNESTSGALSQEVQKADTTTSVTSSANPSKFGQSVTFTATVNVVAPGAGTPAGSVEFFDGATSLGTSALNGSGQASFATSTLSVAMHSITAKYLGNGNYNESTSGALSQEVQRADTTTSLASSANPSKVGQSVTFTASVAVVAPGAGTPLGSVEFFDGATSLGTSALNGSGQASFVTSTLSVATHSIRAKYLGNSNYNESTSGALNQEVEKADTTTTLVSSANPSKFGQAVTFTATVTVQAPGTGTPSGTVTFLDGATTLGTGTVSGGVATLATSTLSVGHHNITAVYGGDASFNGSTSNAVDQEVQKAETATTLVSSTNPSRFGQSVTFTATVTVVAPGAGTASGTVTFTEGATTLGTGTLNGAGCRHVYDVDTGGGPSHHHGDLRRRCELQREHVERRGSGGTEGRHGHRARVLGEPVEGRAVGDVHGDGDGRGAGAGTPTGTVSFMDGATTLGTGTFNGAGGRPSRRRHCRWAITHHGDLRR